MRDFLLGIAGEIGVEVFLVQRGNVTCHAFGGDGDNQAFTCGDFIAFQFVDAF